MSGTLAGQNVATLLARAARCWGSRPALALGGQVIADYAALARRAAAVAAGLRRLGLGPGDRIALFLGNCPEYVELLFGAWYAGMGAVPVNAKLHAEELRYILDDSGTGACFVTPDVASRVAPLAASCPGVRAFIETGTGAYRAQFPDVDAGAADPLPRAADDLAWLFYTSGTTGRPKGVTITHRNLVAMTHCYFSDVDAIGPGDAILHAAPMSHGSGLYILPHVAQAALNIVPESGGFDAAEILDLLQVHHGVTMFAAPTMVKRLVEFPVERPAGGLKTIVYGGGPMYVADAKRGIERFGQKFVQIFGQGESPMTITALSRALHGDAGHPRYEQRLGSVGVPMTGVEVVVADADDRPLPAGEVGEVLVRGLPVMAGYWRKPEASAETLRNGWLHTGDVGSFDDDGFLTLRDRSKDVIISGGSNIYPREVEEVLQQHPEVAEVSVVGAPDREWGESVVAFVVPRQAGRGPSGWPALQASLDAFCLDHIARFKRPKEYRFVDNLPKNNAGKILKTELRRRLAGAA
jgi:long-chain acyl-CoA synthetase